MTQVIERSLKYRSRWNLLKESCCERCNGTYFYTRRLRVFKYISELQGKIRMFSIHLIARLSTFLSARRVQLSQRLKILENKILCSEFTGGTYGGPVET